MITSPDFTVIKKIQDNEDNLGQLIEQLKTPLMVIPFIGAGLSIPFGFPSWRDFLADQAKKAEILDKILQHVDAGEYEEAAEILLEKRGYRAFHDAINNVFSEKKLEGRTFWGAISKIPQLSAGPVITTNFDHVIEEAFKQADRQFEHVVWGVKADMATKALQQNRIFLLKIHGDSEDSTDRILTKSDYEARYCSPRSSKIDFSRPLPRVLRQILFSRPLLFLGCSLKQDRTVEVLKDVVHNDRSLANYAILEQPRSRDEFLERSRFLSEHNIRPIWYPHGEHFWLEAILSYIVEAIVPEDKAADALISLLNEKSFSTLKKLIEMLIILDNEKAIKPLIDLKEKLSIVAGESHIEDHNLLCQKIEDWTEKKNLQLKKLVELELTVFILDKNGEPTTAILTDENWILRVNWNVPDFTQMDIKGNWELRIYLESYPLGQEVKLNAYGTSVPIKSKREPQSYSTDINIYPSQVSMGFYKIITTVQYDEKRKIRFINGFYETPDVTLFYDRDFYEIVEPFEIAVKAQICDKSGLPLSARIISVQETWKILVEWETPTLQNRLVGNWNVSFFLEPIGPSPEIKLPQETLAMVLPVGSNLQPHKYSAYITIPIGKVQTGVYNLTVMVQHISQNAKPTNIARFLEVATIQFY